MRHVQPQLKRHIYCSEGTDQQGTVDAKQRIGTRNSAVSRNSGYCLQMYLCSHFLLSKISVFDKSFELLLTYHHVFFEIADNFESFCIQRKAIGVKNSAQQDQQVFSRVASVSQGHRQVLLDGCFSSPSLSLSFPSPSKYGPLN